MTLREFVRHMVETHALQPERKSVAECNYLAQELAHVREHLWFGTVLGVWVCVDDRSDDLSSET